MLHKLLASEIVTTSTTSVLVNVKEDISLAGLLFLITGTNDATETSQVEEIGTIRFRAFGEDIVDGTWQYFYSLGLLTGGTPAEISSAGAAFAHSCVVPFRFGDKNVFFVSGDDNAQIEVAFDSAFLAHISTANATLQIVGLVEHGLQMYTPRIRQFNESLAASQDKVIPLPVENIDQIWLADALTGTEYNLASSNISRVKVEIGDNSGTVSLTALIHSASNLLNHESTTLPARAIPIYRSAGDIRSKMQDNAQLTIYNGSGGTAAAKILVFSRRMNSKKWNRTRALRDNDIAKLQQKKVFAGHTDAVKALNALK